MLRPKIIGTGDSRYSIKDCGRLMITGKGYRNGLIIW